MTRGNKRIFELLGVTDTAPEWHDWHWQYSHRIMDTEQLSALLELSAAQKADIETCLQRFRMAITPYYASLIDIDDPADPIRAQAVPTINETRTQVGELLDPLDEENASPVANIVHRYPDRALFLVTRCCAMYCRHCTRRRLVGEEDIHLSPEAIDAALAYIQSQPEIKDVLISGGDPLTLSDEELGYILAGISRIDHVKVIRIGTRVPVTMPMRITPEFLEMIKAYQPVWINTHFNHPRELTPAALEACAAIVDAGIPLGNQSVLLRGINDDTETIKTLLLGLIAARIRPYYLYQCDISEGLGHFRTDVRVGMKIIEELRGNISGFAIPLFIIDAPGGKGKIPINPEYIVSIDAEKVIMRNDLGQICEYPQPEIYDWQFGI